MATRAATIGRRSQQAVREGCGREEVPPRPNHTIRTTDTKVRREVLVTTYIRHTLHMADLVWVFVRCGRWLSCPPYYMKKSVAQLASNGPPAQVRSDIVTWLVLAGVEEGVARERRLA